MEMFLTAWGVVFAVCFIGIIVEHLVNDDW